MAKITSAAPRSTVEGDRLTLDDRKAKGRAARTTLPRGHHAVWEPGPNRPDPISLLESQDHTRLPKLIPTRFAKMAESPLTFYRGAAIVMAEDLASTPTTPLNTQLCGDAHLSNFGISASPERRLLFDVDDFDETLLGPWEWDLKRLAASFVIASRESGLSDEKGREAVRRAVRSYASRMRGYAGESDIDVWYSRVTVDEVIDLASDPKEQRAMHRNAAKARKRDNPHTRDKYTEVSHGRRRFKHEDDLVRFDGAELLDDVKSSFGSYRKTLQDDRRHLLRRYEVVDVAEKVVGIGSVGRRCYVALLVGRNNDDVLLLQIKEAEASVLGRKLPKSPYRNQGQRVVAGQRLMQAASDMFLGWIRREDGRDYYWRQLRDMKGSVNDEELSKEQMSVHAVSCGWALARAHARSGDRVAIAAYIGNGDRLERALADFAVKYADQNEQDFDELTAARKSGRVPTDTDI